jgi:hypothetical protein
MATKKDTESRGDQTATPKRKYQRKPTDGANPSERRQATVYFPLGLLRRAKHYGIDYDRELSDIVTEAVREYLDRLGAPE